MPKVVPEYKEQAKRKIVQHAMMLFSEKGYTQTKMAAIAESVGVSKGAIYQYFKSKLELLLAVFEEHAKLREREVRSFMDSAGLRSIASGEFFDRMLELRMGSPLLTQELVQELSKTESAMEWFQANSEKWLQELEDLIDALVERNQITLAISSESLARGLIALRDGLYSSLSLGSDVNKVRKAWVDIIGILLEQTTYDSH